MRKLITLVCAALVAVPQSAVAQQKAAEPAPGTQTERSAKLPVRRVVLYKNGVGYFEHQGRVRGNQETTIDFTSGQLNDVLKSLTILDLGGGRITGVSYNSEAPLAQRLGKLRLPLGPETTVAQFLGAMRGARLEVRNGASVMSGRLLSVERKTRISGGTTLEVDVISLVTDAGEVRAAEMTPSTTVRIAERDLNEEVGRYLGLVASTRQQDLRRMVVSTAGTGERRLFVSYISEVPIWKTTYRLVLPSKAGAKPLLQGWAIVDNTVGEDWEDVELSLVAGAPQSFIQQLSQPYYSRRPVVPLPEAAELTPQTHQATLIGGYGRLMGQVVDPSGAVVPGARVNVSDESGAQVAQGTTDYAGNYSFSSLPDGNYRVEFESPGFKKFVVQNLAIERNWVSQNATLEVGTVSDTVTVMAESNAVNTNSALSNRTSRNVGSGRGLGSGSGLGGRGVGSGEGAGVAGGMLGGPAASPSPLSTGAARAAMLAAAQGQELGDLFEYKMKERVAIRKNQSALVPILQTEITAEKVSLWNATSGSSRPRRALWLTNSSALTLDGGSFSVLEDETFAGEGLMEPMKPAEKRLLSYAADLGVIVDAKQESERQRVTRVRIVRGVMIHSREERESKAYVVRNEDTVPRTVVIEHPVRGGWKLGEGLTPVETSAGFHRFRLTVEPKKTATLTVPESHPLETRHQLTNLDEDQIKLFLSQRSINAQVEAALRPVVEQKGRVSALEAQVTEREEERDRIFDDQQRLRENLKSLKGSAEEKALTQRYTKQLDEQENRLDALRAEITDLEKRKQQAQAELDKMIQELTLDVNL